ncbi:MAG: hypothetical protein M3Z13_08350 [Candidatus Dormibacteraeota bacterium]|nr:hypothetical protein [Candidatus Dormibacteraeota bacterium]
MELANTEISINLGAAIRRRYLRARVALPLHTIDVMLEDLELLNLAGRRRVPFDWDLPLARLVAILPAEVHSVPDLRSNISTNRLMDRLYELQDALLDLKLGPIRRHLRDFDRDELGMGADEAESNEESRDVA